VTEPGWERLDPRMLLIGPFRVVRQFAVPALIALIGIGTSDLTWSVSLLPVLVVGAVVLGALPWLTTYFRRTETQLQVRRGLVQRTVVTAPLDRVRSVDLESSLLRRALGLTTVTIGTGVDETRIELDALDRRRADELRTTLLRRGTPVTAALPDDEQPAVVPQQPEQPEQELARIDWSWLRFAPFSLSRLVIVAGAFGALSQAGDDLPLDRVEPAWEWLLAQALPLVLAGVAIACLVGWLVLSVGEYVLRWWDLRLVRQDANLRLTAGLFTTRSTSIEEARIRGVELIEPVLMRFVGGAELSTLATGVGSGGTTKVLPPCPVPVARRVGATVLEDPRPLELPLVPHGPAARRRRHVRGQLPTVVGTAGTVLVVVGTDTPVWLVPVVLVVLAGLGAAVAEAAYRNLGHALAPGHLVVGAPSAARVRVALERDGVIGWVVRQSPFQRRAGLATLVATTAAGPEQVQVVDVPLERALALARAATPGVLDEFLPTGPPGLAP
jgi:putative membrane protein